MLDLLAKQAKDSEPGFILKYVRWAIILHSDKGFLGIQELGDCGNTKNRGLEFIKCPDLSQSELVSGSEAKSHFLVETAAIIVLLGVSDTKEGIKFKSKHEYFLGTLEKAGEAFPELATVAEYLADEEILNRIRTSMLENNVKPNDKVTFQLDEKFLVEEEFWHDWWRHFRRSLSADNKKQKPENAMVCFISGERVKPATTHSKIKGLSGVGGLGSGDVLVGFDKAAFRSYGLSQSANAAMSEEAMSAYRAGLNRLIEKNSTNLAGAKVVHWYKKHVEKKEDPLEWWAEPPEIEEQIALHKAKEILESIKVGERPDLGSNEYYALTLSGAGGRVMVRDWMTGPFEELVKNINQWFDDLEIISLSSGVSVKPPSAEHVITCLLPPRKPKQKYEDWIKPIGSERVALLQAAIKGTPFPYSILPRLVLENRSFIPTGEMEKLLDNKERANKGLMYSIMYARMALMKAYHIRKYRKRGDDDMAKLLTVGLNEAFPAPAYQCGRLMAVLAELQRAALGDVGAGIVQRYYAAVSTTPALVLGRLTRTSQHHLNKLEPKLAWWYEQKICGIWNQLNETLPRTLNMEEQSLFAMGYYQQLANMRTKKTNVVNKEKNND